MKPSRRRETRLPGSTIRKVEQRVAFMRLRDRATRAGKPFAGPTGPEVDK
jgi:hypothetical protein